MRAETINSRRQAAGRDVKACWQLRQELCGKARASPPQPAVTAQEANQFFVAKPQRVQQTTLYAPLAQVAEHVTPFLTELSNAIIIEREWPRCWKEAKVRTVWKNKGSRREIKTYRPIALLPAVSRVIEKIIAKQLMAQIQMVAALPHGQHGFRSRHGTHTAVMHLVAKIVEHMERREDVVLAAMDLSAAFDTVHHKSLLQKLRERAGVQGHALALLESYLTARQQRVHMRKRENFEGIEIVQYADDCTLVIPIPEGEDPSISTQRQVQRFVDYCAANRIAAEPEKTQLLHIQATRRMPPRAVFSKLKTKLPGRWWASSKQLEVPRLTVGDLIARYDDETQYPITQGENDRCEMEDWTVSSVKGRHVYWRNSSGDTQVRWTRY
eukprot:gene19351-biopygen3414